MKDTNNSKEYIKAKYNEMKQIDEVSEEDSLEPTQNEVNEEINKKKEINDLKARIERTMQEYAIGMAEENLSKTRQQIMRNKISLDIKDLDEKYQIFRRKSYRVANSFGKYKKNICFSKVDISAFFLYVNETMEKIKNKYKNDNIMGSFINFFSAFYEENMREAMFEDIPLKKENNDNKIYQIKKLTRKKLEDVFKQDKNFLAKVKDMLSKKDKEYLNYSKLKKFFVKCMIEYVDITPENKKFEEQELYKYINKKEIEEKTSFMEREYIINAKSKDDSKVAKESLYKIIDRLYDINEYGKEKNIMDNNIIDTKYFKDMISKIENISIKNLKIIIDKLPEIEEYLVEMYSLFEDFFAISDIQRDDEGKQYSIIDRYNANKGSVFKDAREIFIECMNICEKISLSKSEGKIALYMYQYVILDFLRRGHNDLVIQDYANKYIEKEFKEFYNKEIPIEENPNYIGANAGIKTVPSIKKIEHRAVECITKFLGMQYDTVRKTKKRIENKMNRTVEEKAKLKSVKRLMEDGI